MANAYTTMSSPQSKQPVSDLVRIMAWLIILGSGFGAREPRRAQEPAEGLADEAEDPIRLASSHTASRLGRSPHPVYRIRGAS